MSLNDLQEADTRQTGSAADADDRALVGSTLRRLDAKTREIGLLHHLSGLTQEEVADATGYSRKTVGKKLKQFAEAFTREQGELE